MLAPILLGVALAAVFVVGGYVVQRAGPAGRAGPVRARLAERGSTPVLVVITAFNGVAEELFFRGAAYAATTRHPVPVTAVAYTLATRRPATSMLTFAAVLLGVVVGLQRRASGGILAPILTHCTWSLSMLFLLPLIFL